MHLRAHEVARAAGISKNTLLRWLKAGKVPEAARDRNGWRIFTEDDVARVKAYAGRTTPPEEFHEERPLPQRSQRAQRAPAGKTPTHSVSSVCSVARPFMGSKEEAA